MPRDEIALTVHATVVDRPTRELALIDAGSKAFSSDRLPDGTFARPRDGRNFSVTRLSEEHGFVTGPEVEALQIGETVAWIPAHVCPVVNLGRHLHVVTPEGRYETWNVEASGCNY
jgi:D-serine deaminase-like pyridoxal phosphate-dependent protein